MQPLPPNFQRDERERFWARKLKEHEMDKERAGADWCAKHAQDYAFWVEQAQGCKRRGLKHDDFEQYAAEAFDRLSKAVEAVKTAKREQPEVLA